MTGIADPERSKSTKITGRREEVHVAAARAVDDGDTVVVIDGRYRVEAELGRGGMGVVHRGTQLALDRPVAIKRLLQSVRANDASVQRFRREAFTASRLAHPGIVGVLDAGIHDGTPYLVMELVEGEPLESHIARRGFLPVLDALAIAAQISDALASAHEAGILHRDVKPGNAILALDGRVRLLDFGLATLLRDQASRLTHQGVLVGTPDYLAPEIAGGAHPDPRGDVYALGATLYQMLTGRAPFERATPLLTVLAHLSAELIPPSRLIPGIPPSVDALVAELMARDPGDRPKDARVALDRIDRILAAASTRQVEEGDAEAIPLTDRDLDAVLLAALAGD